MADGVLVTVSWTIKPEAATDFVPKLKGDFEHVVERPGFRNIRLHHGVSDPTRFVLVEEWDTAQSFEDYMEYRNAQGNVAEFFEWSLAAPEIVIYDLAADLNARK